MNIVTRPSTSHLSSGTGNRREVSCLVTVPTVCGGSFLGVKQDLGGNENGGAVTVESAINLVEYPINLLLHGVGTAGREMEPDEDMFWVTRTLLGEILDLALERPEISLSVDDCNTSDVEIILPALTSRGLRATFFPISSRLGRAGSLSGDGLREIASAGMRVGSHGRRHISWRRLPESVATEEFVTARRELEEIVQQGVNDAACPFGAYDRSTLRQLRSHGYDHAYTSDAARASAVSWLQPRYTMTSSDDIGGIRRLVDRGGLGTTRQLDKLRVAVKTHRW